MNNQVFKITRQEFLKLEYVDNLEQWVLGLLKEKGAPVDGIVYFSVKDGYQVSAHKDLHTSDMIYSFRTQNEKA